MLGQVLQSHVCRTARLEHFSAILPIPLSRREQHEQLNYWIFQMHYLSIKSHLKPYLIVARRRTTINHAFAAAIAPSDTYSDSRVREAILVLGQDPDQDLNCAYCGAPAQTWDHVFATVKDSSFSGFGHRLGNLLPCCKPCNSAKGNKNWQRYIVGLNLPDCEERATRIDSYLTKYATHDAGPQQSPDYERLLQIKEQVMTLLAEADRIAKAIRENKWTDPFNTER